MIKNVILILGMHRSGTSAITRSFNLLGAALPKTLLGANEGNARGHWESQSIINAHDAMLTILGSDWKDYRILSGMIGTRARKSYVDAMADMIEAEYGMPNEDGANNTAQTIVIKEPRICRFAPLYLEAIEAVGAKVHVILPSRNPLEVMASLQHRDGMSAQDAMFLWLTHMLEAEIGSRGVSRSFVDYADFLEDPTAACARIIKDMPFKLPFTLKAAEPQITAFVNPGLKRESARPEDVTQHPLAGGWSADCYQAFLMLAGAPNAKPALASLDRIRMQYYPAIHTIQDVQKDYNIQLADKDAALAKCGDDLSALAQSHEKKWKAAEAETEAALKAAKEKTESDVQALIKDYENTYAAEKDAAQKRLNTLLTESTAEIDTLKAEKDAAQERFNTLLTESTAEIDTLKAEKDAAQERFNTLLTESAAEIDTLKAEKDAAQERFNTLLTESAAEIDTLKAEKDAVQEQFNTLLTESAAEIDTIKAEKTAQIDTLESERIFMQNEFATIVNDLEKALADKEAALADAYHSLHASQQRLQSVLSSSSWRMTRGVRAAVNMLRGTKIEAAAKALPEPQIPPRITHED